MHLTFELKDFLEIQSMIERNKKQKTCQMDKILVPVRDYVDQHCQVNFLIPLFHLIVHLSMNDELKSSNNKNNMKAIDSNQTFQFLF